MNVLPRLKNFVPGVEDAETKLVTAAQQGSREAFDKLLRAYERQLRGFLARRVGPQAVDDVLQETWLAGWIALPRYTRRARFKAWIFAIAFHKCTDYHRSRMRSAVESPLEEADRRGVHQADGYAAAELKHIVHELLVQLPPEQREVLEIYYYADLTLAEVAQVLNRNLSTVKSQFYRAHALMAQGLETADTPQTAYPINGKARNRNEL